MYSIEHFRRLNRPESMVLTQHSRKRFAERGISMDDIGYVFRTGEMIAQYSDDTPLGNEPCMWWQALTRNWSIS